MCDAQVNVYLIGHTEVDLFPVDDGLNYSMPGNAAGSEFEARLEECGAQDGGTGQELIEFAGRLCYESFNLPNEKTADNSKYVRSIVKKQHESVLEHVSVTFYVDGVSRNLSHELIRHRHLSFSELSQRYVNMEDSNFVNPPLFREVDPDRFPVKSKLGVAEANMYKHNVREAEAKGYSRKEARQAARYTLPAGMETKFVVSGNLRAWRDVLKKRFSKHADKEMQEFAEEVLAILGERYPDVFADIKYGE